MTLSNVGSTRRRRRTLFVVPLAAVLLSMLVVGQRAAVAIPAGSGPRLVSVSTTGIQSNGPSSPTASSFSADGRYILLFSAGSNLVEGDTNGQYDLFVRDLLTGITTRVNVASDGTQANSFFAGGASLSANGRFVIFGSFANNLVPGDTNGTFDVFAHDRLTGVTTRVSVAPDGTQANDMSLAGYSTSADGRYLTFVSWASNLVEDDTNGVPDAFVRDLVAGVTTRVSIASDGSQANGRSDAWSLSADGRFVVFSSSATNLVPDDSNEFDDVYIHDRLTGETARVSVALNGDQGNGLSTAAMISGDGSAVLFLSNADNFVDGDTNQQADLFVHVRSTGEIDRVNVASDGTEANDESNALAVIGTDGNVVVFGSAADNLVEGDTNNLQEGPSNGQFEVWDTFMHDRQTGMTTRVNVSADGAEANGGMDGFASISANGRFIAFDSAASNLVAGDTNDANDAFILEIESDQEPPTISITADPSDTLAASNWYNRASSGADGVTVMVVAADDSDVINLTCTDNGTTVVLSTTGSSGTFTLADGIHTISCTASDGVENTGASPSSTSMPVYYQIDQTPPTLAPTVSPNPVTLNDTASVSANPSDSGSGVEMSNCESLDTAAIGSKIVVCSATDIAGNSTTVPASYTVTYSFPSSGFAPPVDSFMLNVAKAGKAIPLKWRITDASGAPVTNLTTAIITTISLNCASLSTGSDAVEEYAAGASGLQNLGDGYYQINWKSPSTYANTCRQLRLDMGEGIYHTANFQFKK